MRKLRNELGDRVERSQRIRDALGRRPEVIAARRVLMYDPLPAEPDVAPLAEQLRRSGVSVALPEDAGLEASWPDVVIAPGLAFTADGDRLGQGGGWYDRFLARCRSDVVVIGVCFAPQLLDSLPTEPHDVVMYAVITD